ncbi:MAG: hypothetical protein L0241_08270 [Planctomycetia bacterium]|nr:hypothetical protein [Planctomycetia bacterium]
MDYDTKPSACLVFFGVRYLSAERADEETDPRAKAAEAHDLFVWSGKRYPPNDPAEPYFLLIGECINHVAFDGSCEDSAELGELPEVIRSTTAKLAQAGFTETPELWVQCKYD